MKMKVKNMATLFALLAASIYSINIPLSKLLLKHVETTMMAGLLYFGAGIGLIILTNIMKFIGTSKKQEPLTRKELPYTIAMVILDIIAPILLNSTRTLVSSDMRPVLVSMNCVKILVSI